MYEFSAPLESFPIFIFPSLVGGILEFAAEVKNSRHLSYKAADLALRHGAAKGNLTA